MMDRIINKMFDTNELNRLQRCAKNKDKKEIIKWGQDFEARLAEFYHKRYKEYYLKEYEEKLKDINIALLYVLHFGETTKFGNKRLKEIMNDLNIAIKDLENGEFKRIDYINMLEKDGIKIEPDI